jgi:hypothetical protein
MFESMVARDNGEGTIDQCAETPGAETPSVESPGVENRKARS